MDYTHRPSGAQAPRPPCAACDGNTDDNGAESLTFAPAGMLMWLCARCVDACGKSPEAMHGVFEKAYSRSGWDADLRRWLESGAPSA